MWTLIGWLYRLYLSRYWLGDAYRFGAIWLRFNMYWDHVTVWIPPLYSRDTYRFVFYDINTDTDTTFWYRHRINSYCDTHKTILPSRKLFLAGKQRPVIRSTASHMLSMPSQKSCIVETRMVATTEFVRAVLICEISILSGNKLVFYG